MQKNSCRTYWNVRTLVFMALLVSMHLVLTRVLVVELGAYRIFGWEVSVRFCRSLDGPGSRSCLRFYGGHPGMLHERICGGSLYHRCRACWGTDPRTGEIFLCRQEPESQNGGYGAYHCGDCGDQFAVLTTSGLVLFQGYNFFTIIRADWFSLRFWCHLLCADLFSVFQPLTFLVMDTVKPAVLKKKTV